MRHDLRRDQSSQSQSLSRWHNSKNRYDFSDLFLYWGFLHCFQQSLLHLFLRRVCKKMTRLRVWKIFSFEFEVGQLPYPHLSRLSPLLRPRHIQNRDRFRLIHRLRYSQKIRSNCSCWFRSFVSVTLPFDRPPGERCCSSHCQIYKCLLWRWKPERKIRAVELRVSCNNKCHVRAFRCAIQYLKFTSVRKCSSVRN